ncbi:type VII secretion protein EccE [Mycolicibacterium litorale]|uniref:ESX-3 secretion system protein EccE3 n=1 Tax=Mycolicibacterium litorale TaxID=758802 RepID=A0AAD1INH6_9MYCO|nr:type VII secretion protein EccE [Mycolicibacterium litorale]MCV7416958.1 type VII secretion protein EccE [Mycolicibacterium litorale]TDY04743.1 type VII secretion protein EccE [Mycolicibacterium litorale]BBY18171.1 ESX-3 secretion system protein EccE3 [Mycolicibacterium litorale]
MTARITLALLFVIPAALAYPWPTTAERWVLGVSIAVVVVLFAWWRGLFVTDIVRRRIAILLRNRRGGHSRHAPAQYATVALRVDSAPSGDLPLALLAGYVDRYGVRAHKVRVVSRDVAGERTTWIALTVGAKDNLAALQARSAHLPLRETTEIAARRLTDHLREVGWTVTPVDEAPSPAPPSARETWRGLRSDEGHVAAYRVSVDGQLADTLAAVAAQPSAETWTALDIVGTSKHLEVIVGCTLLTEDKPKARAPLAGLTPQRGRHRPAVETLHPLSVERLEGHPVPVTEEVLHGLRWPVAHGAPAAVS